METLNLQINSNLELLKQSGTNETHERASENENKPKFLSLFDRLREIIRRLGHT